MLYHTVCIWVTVVFPVLLYHICPCQQLTCFSSSHFTPLLRKNCLVLAVTSTRFTVLILKINHNQPLKAIYFLTCHFGTELTLSVKPSNSIRNYPIFLHMSMWRPPCCHCLTLTLTHLCKAAQYSVFSSLREVSRSNAKHNRRCFFTAGTSQANKIYKYGINVMGDEGYTHDELY